MNLVERAKGIIVSPATEWKVIDREPGDAGFLFGNYLAILAAIPAVCGCVGWVLEGRSILWALKNTVIRYLISFILVYVLALIVDQIAPAFGGRRAFTSALKLAVYAATSAALGGIFLLIPGINFLFLVGILYTFYLLWTGIPPMMNAPRERSVIYTAVVIMCMLVVVVLFMIAYSLVVGFQEVT